MKILEEDIKINTREILNIKDEMIGIVKAELKDYETLKTAIEHTNTRIDYIVNEIKKMEQREIVMINDMEQIHYALYYVSYVVGSLFPAIERKLSMYEYLITQIGFLLDALDNLSNGLLSHKLI